MSTTATDTADATPKNNLFRKAAIIGASGVVAFVALVVGATQIGKSSETAASILNTEWRTCDSFKSGNIYSYDGVNCQVCSQDESNITFELCDNVCTGWLLDTRHYCFDPIDVTCEEITPPELPFNESCPPNYYLTVEEEGCNPITSNDINVFLTNCEFCEDPSSTLDQCIDFCENNDQCVGYVTNPLDPDNCYVITNAMQSFCGVSQGDAVTCKKQPTDVQCFEADTALVPFAQAESRCQVFGGVLAPIEDEFSFNRVQRKCQDTTDTGCYVDFGQADECFYVNGADEENVTQSASCDTRRYYCCEFPTTQFTNSPTASPIEEGVVTPPGTIPEAIQFCQNEGGVLFRVTDEASQAVAEQQCAAAMAENPGSCGCWIDAAFLSGPDIVFAITDSTPLSFTDFALGQPDLVPDPSNPRCIVLRQIEAFKWDDVNCNTGCGDGFVQPVGLCQVLTKSPTLSPTASPIPTLSPTLSPTLNPTTAAPTGSPVTRLPTLSPTLSPTLNPTVLPTFNPTASPTKEPTRSPTKFPTESPTTSPTGSPTLSPTNNPTTSPTTSPTDSPTLRPTVSPTDKPSTSPTTSPTDSPTVRPTGSPTGKPTTSPTTSPTDSPTVRPTGSPTDKPTTSPTTSPTDSPTVRPTGSPTNNPTTSPTTSPSEGPTKSPTQSPSTSPTTSPTSSPTNNPTVSPTTSPSQSPTNSPTSSPTNNPTTSPTKNPTSAPSNIPTKSPTKKPTSSPTKSPTASPTDKPTTSPTASPTDQPTTSPTTSPTDQPTTSPTTNPTKSPTKAPTSSPTDAPTNNPTQGPTKSPTASPSAAPTDSPTTSPTDSPTTHPTKAPTGRPTTSPTEVPTKNPTARPTDSPTGKPTSSPSEKPTSSPTEKPSASPTKAPTSKPTESPTKSPTDTPTHSPTESPTGKPTESPTKLITRNPTESPTEVPTKNPTPTPTKAPTVTGICKFKNGEALWQVYNDANEYLKIKCLYSQSGYSNYVYDPSIYSWCSAYNTYCPLQEFVIRPGDTKHVVAPSEAINYFIIDRGCKFDYDDGQTYEQCKLAEGTVTIPEERCKCVDHEVDSESFDSYHRGNSHAANGLKSTWSEYSYTRSRIIDHRDFTGTGECVSGKCMDLVGKVRDQKFYYTAHLSRRHQLRGLTRYIDYHCTVHFQASGTRRCGSNKFHNAADALSAGCLEYYPGKYVNHDNSFKVKVHRPNDDVLCGIYVKDVPALTPFKRYSVTADVYDSEGKAYVSIWSEGQKYIDGTNIMVGNIFDEISVVCCCVELFDHYVYEAVFLDQGLTGDGVAVPQERSNVTKILNRPALDDFYVGGNQDSSQVYSMGIGGMAVFKFESGFSRKIIIYEETVLSCKVVRYYDGYCYQCYRASDVAHEDVSVEASVDGINFVSVDNSLLDNSWFLLDPFKCLISGRSLQEEEAEETSGNETEPADLVLDVDSGDDDIAFDQGEDEYFASNPSVQAATRALARTTGRFHAKKIAYTKVYLPFGNACYKYLRLTDTSPAGSRTTDDGFDLHAIKTFDVCCTEADNDDEFQRLQEERDALFFERFAVGGGVLQTGIAAGVAAFTIFVIASVICALAIVSYRTEKTNKRSSELLESPSPKKVKKEVATKMI